MKKALGYLLTFSAMLALCLSFSSCDLFGECSHKNASKEVFEPTCAEKGYTVYSCPDCSLTFEADFIAPLGHTFTDETVEPTCTSEGYVKHVCSVCGAEERSDFVQPCEHDYDITVIKPTCEKQGYTYAKCKDCDYYKSYDFVKPTGHVMKKTSVEPTCTSEGYTIYSCEDCSYSYKSDLVAPAAHSFNKNTVKPTCEDEGYTIYSCKGCSYSFVSDFIEPTGHIYETEKVRPNLEKTGYTVYTCTACESEHISDFVFYSDIFTGAAGEGKGEIAWGVDVSYHNGEIDWKKLKAAGIDFAIIRLGSSNGIDSMFEENYAGAKAAGIDVGVYFYTYSLDADGAKRDAELTVKWLKGKKLEYPVFYDIEDYDLAGYYPSELPEETLMAMCHTYMSALVDADFYPGLYTNNSFLYNKYNEEKVLGLYDVWYARYRYNDYTDFEMPYSATYSIWQYSDKGQVSGIEGNCDLNMAFKDYPEIMKKHGFNGY